MGILVAVVTGAAATGLRWAIDPWLDGFPFVTYFPAVLLTAFVGGWIPAAIGAVVELGLAYSLFFPAFGSPELAGSGAVALASDTAVVVAQIALVEIAASASGRQRAGFERPSRDLGPDVPGRGLVSRRAYWEEKLSSINDNRMRWGLALALFLAPLAILLASSRWLGSAPVILFLPAIFITVLLSGRNLAWIILAAAGLCEWYFFGPSAGSLWLTPRSALPLLAFLIAGAVGIAVLGMLVDDRRSIAAKSWRLSRTIDRQSLLARHAQDQAVAELESLASYLAAQGHDEAANRVTRVAERQRASLDSPGD